MGAKRIAVLAAALATVVLAVPLASANGPMGGTETTTLDMPPDGTGAVMRAPMPASSTTGTVGVTEASDDDQFMNALTTILNSAPTRGARVMTCVFLTTSLSREYGEGESISVTEPSLQLLFINLCIQLALNMQQAQSGGQPHGLAHASAARCNQVPVSMPVHITKTGSGYSATVNGTTSKPTKMAFRATCKRTAKSLKTTIRPTARHGKLSKAIGPILSAGFVSKSASAGKLKITLGVR